MRELDALITATGFEGAASEIRRSALPCLDILYAGVGDDAPLGSSRLGGAPDLPSDVPWPVNRFGQPLSFYGQIDLAEVVTGTFDGDLPHNGLLSLFVGSFEVIDDPVSVETIFTAPGINVARLEPPEELSAFEDEKTANLRPIYVRFEPRLSFPTSDQKFIEIIEPICPEGDIDALIEGLEAAPENIGQLLGYAPWPLKDLRAAIHFHEIGRRGQERLRQWRTWEAWVEAKNISHRLKNGTIYRPWSSKDDENVRWLLDHKTQIDDGINKWRSFLTIESNRYMNLWINDADAVYTFINTNELHRGEFKDLRATATQS